MTKADRPHIALHLLAATALMLGVPTAVQAQDPSAVEQILSFDEAGEKLAEPARIAYLAECAQNAYCQARVHGMEAAAEKYGFEFKLFDANFSPAEQLKQVQNAAAEGFDGYIIGPTAAAPACNMWRNFLVPTEVPVVSLDLPMCGDVHYTEGLAASVMMQRQAFFSDHVANAFESCEGEPCKAAAVGGFVGSDLFNLWQIAIEEGLAAYPNVEVVVNQPGNFDPRQTLRIIQDGLRAHPDIELVLSPWDDMTRGAEQAITSVGLAPGEDVRIYSVGGTIDAVEKVKAGIYNETSVLLPFQESYYAGVAMVMALMDQPLNAFIDEALLPEVVDGPGTVFITQENADSFEPEY
ncbi:MAG: sugar ABC transporter substrate-binding protein [Pseudomonadota bacterium]|nr:sugar ABC transporter substrate-binding protein [Pseudomonadota bacterium]